MTKISDRPCEQMSLIELKDEWNQLHALLDMKVFPGGGTGWNNSILDRIDTRLNSVQSAICKIVCKETKE